MSTAARQEAVLRQSRPARPWERPAAWTASILIWLGASGAASAVVLGSAVFMAASSVAIAWGFALRDVAHARQGHVSPITFFALSAGLAGMANVVGLSAAETEKRPLYFLYAADEHLFFAMQLMLVGSVLPILAFWIVQRSSSIRVLAEFLPPVEGNVDERHLIRNAVLIVLVVYAIWLTIPLDSLGTIGSVFLLLPHFMIFILARVGGEKKDQRILLAALGIAVLEATRALMFAFLRSEILLPLLAFVFGSLLGRRSLEPLRWKVFVPVYAALAVFILYFGAFAQVRGSSGGGLERLEAVQAFEEQQAVNPQPRRSQTVMSRLTSFNQLTQVRRIVEEEGLLEGQTLEYLAYAFVPRVIWPEKPIIAKGQWFAGRIGQGFPTENGGFSNSVNMTVPGELYLNFGWPGVVVGCFIFGGLLALLWLRTDFWTNSRNGVGTAFGFYLLWIGFGMGADLQILVTIIAMYGVFLAVSFGLRGIASKRRAVAPPPTNVFASQ